MFIPFVKNFNQSQSLQSASTSQLKKTSWKWAFLQQDRQCSVIWEDGASRERRSLVMHIWCLQFPNSSLAALGSLSLKLPRSDLCLCFITCSHWKGEQLQWEHKVIGQSDGSSDPTPHNRRSKMQPELTLEISKLWSHHNTSELINHTDKSIATWNQLQGSALVVQSAHSLNKLTRDYENWPKKNNEGKGDAEWPNNLNQCSWGYFTVTHLIHDRVQILLTRALLAFSTLFALLLKISE